MTDDDGQLEPRRARISITGLDPGWSRTFDREAALLRHLLREDLAAADAQLKRDLAGEYAMVQLRTRRASTGS